MLSLGAGQGSPPAIYQPEVNPYGLCGHGVLVVERRPGFRPVRIHDSHDVGPVLPTTVKPDTLRRILTLVDEPQHLCEGYRFALRVHPPPFPKDAAIVGRVVQRGAAVPLKHLFFGTARVPGRGAVPSNPAHTYRPAFRRFAQYAFIRFPIAAFSAALHTCRFGVGFDLAFCFGLSFR